jgi:hypothetical protein
MQASSAILDSMIKFIQAHGNERVEEIKRQAGNDFTVGKEKTIEAEKKRLVEQYQKDLANAEINFKIEKSAQQNAQRIEKMKKINELVESLQREAKLQMHATMSKNAAAYKKLLQ